MDDLGNSEQQDTGRASGHSLLPFKTNVYAKDLDWFAQRAPTAGKRPALLGVLDTGSAGEHTRDALPPVRFTWIIDFAAYRIDAHCSHPVDYAVVSRVARRVAALCDDPASGWHGLLPEHGKRRGSIEFTVTYDPETGTITVEPGARCTRPLLKWGAADLARICDDGAALQGENDALSAELDRIATMLTELQAVVNSGTAVPDAMGTAAKLAQASTRLNDWHSLPRPAMPRYPDRSDLAIDVRAATALLSGLRREVDECEVEEHSIRAMAAALAYLSARVRAEVASDALRAIQLTPEVVSAQTKWYGVSAEVDLIARILRELWPTVKDGGTVPDPVGAGARLAQASARLDGWHSLPVVRTPRCRGRSNLAKDIQMVATLVQGLQGEADEGKTEDRSIAATAAALRYFGIRLRAEADPAAFREIEYRG